MNEKTITDAVMAESADIVAYGAAKDAVVAAARAWHAVDIEFSRCKLADAIEALNALEIQLRERATIRNASND